MKTIIKDFKRFKKLLVIKKYEGKQGNGFSIRIFNYANVIGINSTVGNDKHVIFGDYEKRINSRRIMRVMEKWNIPYTFFFESSHGKYHFIIPQVFNTINALYIAKEMGAETNYLTLSAVRQEFVLRISRKGSKDEPKLIMFFWNEKAFPENVLLSRKFCKFLSLYYDVPSELFDGYPKMRGDKFVVEQYRTTNII